MRLDRAAFAAWLMRQGTPDAALKPYTEGAAKLLESVPSGRPFDQAAVDAFIDDVASRGASETRLRNWRRIAAATLRFVELAAPAPEPPRPAPRVSELGNRVPDVVREPPRPATAQEAQWGLEVEPPDPGATRRRAWMVAAATLGLALIALGARAGLHAFARRSEQVMPNHRDPHLGLELTFPGGSMWRHLPAYDEDAPYEELFPPAGGRSRKAVVRGGSYFRGIDPRRPLHRLTVVSIPLVTDIWGVGKAALERELTAFAEGAARVAVENFTLPGARWHGDGCELRRVGKPIVECRGSIAGVPETWYARLFVIYGRDDAAVTLFLAARPDAELATEAESIVAALNP